MHTSGKASASHEVDKAEAWYHDAMNRSRILVAGALLLCAASGAVWYLREPIDAVSAISIDGRSGAVSTISRSNATQSELAPKGDAVDSAGTTAPRSRQSPDRADEQKSVREARRYSWPEGVDPGGIPFPSSESVLLTCKKYSNLGSGSCGEHDAALTRLAKEGRDRKWAADMEEAIATLVASHRDYYIRAIDCRTTVCAVEIESTLGVFDRRAPDQLKGMLEPVDTVNGYEVKDSNQMVVVTSIVFS